jgi:hypothetical protein
MACMGFAALIYGIISVRNLKEYNSDNVKVMSWGGILIGIIFLSFSITLFLSK